MTKINALKTEQKNEKTANIDVLPTQEILELINNEDKKVAFAVEEEIEHIADAVDVIYRQIAKGGRLIYMGCGTSGRLGILDAAECPPTFGTSPEMVQGLIAGGNQALITAVEGAEDNPELAKEDLKRLRFNQNDVLVGIAASGRTPYVIGGIDYAKNVGAPTVSLTCNPGSRLNQITDISIAPLTGPEVIAGSTRLKSGTAQKMVLNMISTSVMIKLGKVYGNLMVDLKATNEKLMYRAVSIVVMTTGVSEEEAQSAIEASNRSVKTAIVMLKCKMNAKEAEIALEHADGYISKVLEAN